MDRPPFPFSQPLHETRVHKQITHSTIWSEARRASTALAQQRRVPCVAREQGKHGGDEPWMHLLFSLFSYDKTGWPLSVVVRVVVTKQGCLVRKAGQRTVRLTVAPGSWIHTCSFCSSSFAIRLSKIPSTRATIRSRVPRVLFTTRAWGKNVKRILFVAAAVHRRDVERYCSYLQNLRCGLNRGMDRKG